MDLLQGAGPTCHTVQEALSQVPNPQLALDSGLSPRPCLPAREGLRAELGHFLQDWPFPRRGHSLAAVSHAQDTRGEGGLATTAPQSKSGWTCQAAPVGLGVGQGDTYLCFSNSLCEDLFRERKKRSSLQSLTTSTRAPLRAWASAGQCGGSGPQGCPGWGGLGQECSRRPHTE